jgi:hypothetical protein
MNFLPVAFEGSENVSTDPAKTRASPAEFSSSGILCVSPLHGKRPGSVFGKVLSHIGSFTKHSRRLGRIRGLVSQDQRPAEGHQSFICRKAKRDLKQPARQTGPLSNQDLAQALQFAGYKYKLVMTEGGHSGKMGRRRNFRNALRWFVG